jgi:hypothetical protein
MIGEKPVELKHWSGVLDQKESSIPIAHPRPALPRSAQLSPPSPLLGERAGVRWISSTRFLQFTKFCLVGGSGVLVDMGILYLLADPSRLGLNITLRVPRRL